MTTISIQELEELKAKAAKIDERNKKGLDRLHKIDKEHPEKVLERMRKYLDKNRDAYNARRRELRRLKKEAAAAAGKTSGVLFNADA